jgi:hypothetical protein
MKAQVLGESWESWEFAKSWIINEDADCSAYSGFVWCVRCVVRPLWP